MATSKHIALTGSLLFALAACETPHIGSPPPTSTASSDCVPMRLANGRSVCLQSSPLGMVESATTRDGAQALMDPTFVGSTPISWDMRETVLNGCLQVRDQGTCDWCVVHSSGAALDALYCAEGCGTTRVSMPALWMAGHGNQIRVDDCAMGWQVTEGIQTVTSTPLVSESVWPFNVSMRSMLDAQPSTAALAQDPRSAAIGSASISITRDPVQLDAMRHVLVSNRALVVWSTICSGLGEWQSGTTTIHTRTADCPAGTRFGYHAFLIVGYDDTTQEFIGLNSFGTDWGDQGYMHLAYDWVLGEVAGILYLSQIDRSHGACGAPNMTTDVAARCGAVQGCDACLATSGCIFCDGACVEANTAHTGAETATCQNTTLDVLACPLPINGCGIHNDCGSCAADTACAWCEGRSACLAWPSDNLACPQDTRVANTVAQCNDATGECEHAVDCAACMALDGCGWCAHPDADYTNQAHCQGAGSLEDQNFDRGFCGWGDFTRHGGMCPMPVDSGITRVDAGMDDPEAGVQCAALSCGDCVATFGCEFCPTNRRCYDDSEAAACSGIVTRDGAACDVCHDTGGTCNSRNDCCFAATSTSVACIDHVCSDTSMCVMNGSACSVGSRPCCGGSLCGISPSTRTECCLSPGYECTSDAECCGYERCTGGLCQAQRAGQGCLNTEECAGGSWCLDTGVCGTD